MNKHKSMEKRLVIMLSGGLDSSVAYHYALNKGFNKDEIVCIWFDLNQPYNTKEKESLDKIGIPYETIKLDLIQEKFNNIPTKDHPNQIIPGRNLIMATIAASFGERIWMMALDGETHMNTIERDKSTKFFQDTTNLLTYIFNVKRDITVLESPFMNMSKTDIVKWAIDHGVSEEFLRILLPAMTRVYTTVENVELVLNVGFHSRTMEWRKSTQKIRGNQTMLKNLLLTIKKHL